MSKLYDLVNGKEQSEDFTNSSLPKNRREQFSFVIKNNIWKLIVVSLLISIFVLPLFVWNFVFSNYIAYAAEELLKQSPDLVPLQNLLLKSIQYAVNIILLAIGSLGITGGISVIQKMCYDQIVNLGGDFFHGIKENGIKNLLLSLIPSIVLLLFVFNIYYYLYDTSVPQFIIIIDLVIIGIILIIATMMYVFGSVGNFTYVLSKKQLLKNSLLFSVILFVKNLVFFLIALIPLIIFVLVKLFAAKCIIFSLICLFGLSYMLVVLIIYIDSCFDKYINSFQKKDYLRRGMKKE